MRISADVQWSQDKRSSVEHKILLEINMIVAPFSRHD